MSFDLIIKNGTVKQFFPHAFLVFQIADRR
ncbi:Uncharacterised protein [Escherichia coli]|nr:Uncharacterised protein [Escherichia coli]